MVIKVEAALTDGARLSLVVRIPDVDVLAAITIKTFAYGERFAARDDEDLHRLLEVAHADGP